MFEINGKEFRNLEQQVQKNKEDIARHYEIDRSEANLGIRVVGQVAIEQELPDPLTYAGEYGDTYAVGIKEEVDAGTSSYFYYVFSRPAPDSGTPLNHWLNVGKISIVGPSGPQGIQGETGPAGPSTQWFTGLANPPYSGMKEGDFFLNTSNGNLYKYVSESWTSIGNIKGPQGVAGPQGPIGLRGPIGPQGPQGEKGDVGGFINIAGIVENTNQLPTPSSLGNLTIAYLVGESEPYTLYIQVGLDSETAIWENTGPFNAATLVTVGGQAQNVWDADTKLDKENPTFAADNYGCYIYGVVTTSTTSHKPTTVDGMIPSTYLNAPKTIVQRDNTGRIRQAPMDGNLSLSGTGYAFTDGDFAGLIRTFITLASGSSSGTLTNTQYNRLKFSPVLMISLDNELYNKVTDDTTSQVMTYQYINTNAIKTITVNSDRTWTLTTTDQTLYSHNVYITFTTDVGGNGNILLNIINKESNAFTVATLLQYLIDEDLLNADIQASGRYILSGGEGGAVTSFYSVDGTTLSISTIFSTGLVSAIINVTGVTDKIVKLN